MIVKEIKDEIFISKGEEQNSFVLNIPKINNLNFSWINKRNYQNIKFYEIIYDMSEINNSLNGNKTFNCILFSNNHDLVISDNDISSNLSDYIKKSLFENENKDVIFVLKEIINYFETKKKNTTIDMNKFFNYYSILIYLKISKDNNLLDEAIKTISNINSEIIPFKNGKKFILKMINKNSELIINHEPNENFIQSHDQIIAIESNFNKENYISIENLICELNYIDDDNIQSILEYFYVLDDEFLNEFNISLDENKIFSYKNEFIPRIEITTNIEVIKSLKLILNINDQYIKYLNYNFLIDEIKRFLI